MRRAIKLLIVQLNSSARTRKGKIMREIMFRGKRVDNGKWVFGDLIHGVNAKLGKFYILPVECGVTSLKDCDPLDGYNVDPATVGQFTGLLDSADVKIFDGDFVEDIALGGAGMVYWHPDSASFYYGMGGTSLVHNKELVVIGNIHDNPELMEESK